MENKHDYVKILLFDAEHSHKVQLSHTHMRDASPLQTLRAITKGHLNVEKLLQNKDTGEKRKTG